MRYIKNFSHILFLFIFLGQCTVQYLLYLFHSVDDGHVIYLDSSFLLYLFLSVSLSVDIISLIFFISDDALSIISLISFRDDIALSNISPKFIPHTSSSLLFYFTHQLYHINITI